MKNAYSFHPTTGVFIGVDFAQESPREPGVFLLPAMATFVEPPQVLAGKQAVWEGDAWEVQDIPVPEPIPEPEPKRLGVDSIRAQRNRLLFRSDWTQLSDAPLSPELKTSWAVYRKELREMPLIFSCPDEVCWPVIPA